MLDLLCQKLGGTWRTDWAVSLSALEALAGLAKVGTVSLHFLSYFLSCPLFFFLSYLRYFFRSLLLSYFLSYFLSHFQSCYLSYFLSHPLSHLLSDFLLYFLIYFLWPKMEVSVDVGDRQGVLEAICGYIEYQCGRPPMLHSRDLHSVVVAAFHCLSIWITRHADLLDQQVTYRS